MQMSVVQPSRSAFWRFVVGLSALLLFLAILDAVERARALGVDFSSSRAWTGLVSALGLAGLLLLLLLASTWSRYGDRILTSAQFPERLPASFDWLGALFLSLALVGFTFTFMIPAVSRLFGAIGW